MSHTIKQQLDQLFSEWKSVNGGAFIEDGIMMKPDSAIDAEHDWLISKKKVLFFLKDQNQGSDEHWSEDSRRWIVDDNKTKELKYPLFRNIANIFYGLCHIGLEEFNQIWYEELNTEEVKKHFNLKAFAFVEGKKEPGVSTISDKVLKSHLERDKNFIQSEFDILNPNIIVCFGGALFDFVINIYGKDNLTDYGTNGNLKYCKEKETVIIYSAHPAKRFMRSKIFYENCMDSYRAFLKTPQGKIFYEQHR